MQDRRLGLVLFREYPLSSLYSLSIHPITPVLCVLCVNSVSMSSSCSLGICARALPRDPDYSGPLFTLHRRSFRPLPSFSVDPIVGCPFIGHCVLPHPRVCWLASRRPRPPIQGLLADISSATPSYYLGFVGRHLVGHALILSRGRWLASRQPHPPTIQGSLVGTSPATPSWGRWLASRQPHPPTIQGSLADISSATPSYYLGFVGRHLVGHALILSRGRWLASRQPHPPTIQGSLVGISPAMSSYYLGFVGRHVVWPVMSSYIQGSSVDPVAAPIHPGLAGPLVGQSHPFTSKVSQLIQSLCPSYNSRVHWLAHRLSSRALIHPRVCWLGSSMVSLVSTPSGWPLPHTFRVS